MKQTESLIGSEKANNLATMSSQERLNLQEIMKNNEATEWVRRYRKKVLEEGRGEAQYWWQQTLVHIAQRRGQAAADDLRRRMNEQKDKK
jgi:hypothetical protein